MDWPAAEAARGRRGLAPLLVRLREPVGGAVNEVLPRRRRMRLGGGELDQGAIQELSESLSAALHDHDVAGAGATA